MEKRGGGGGKLERANRLFWQGPLSCKLQLHPDKNENKIFLILKEIQMGSGAKLYMRKGFLIYEEMRKYFTIDEEAVSHI
jgi:hypothetical protein